MAQQSELPIERLDVAAFTVPTSTPEADGTLAWDKTTIVVVRAEAGGVGSLGYAYADVAAAQLIDSLLKAAVLQLPATCVKSAWQAMVRAIRNLGRPGICSMAIAAVDTALWDLKARLLGTSLASLLGAARAEIPVYGSGGFTSYSIAQLQSQLRNWAGEDIPAVKMKVGTRPEEDLQRVAAARDAIGPRVKLMVDANGAYSRKQALEKAQAFRDLDVAWFEEPVSSDDLEGLRLIRDQAPPGMEIAAGEYGYHALYFRRMLESGAVDVLQADATRCAGVTGFLQTDGLCQGFQLPLSAHTAPTLHAHLCCAVLSARDVEYFHDHIRIEQMFFDGALVTRGGKLRPDLTRPGLGLELKCLDVEKYRVYGNTDSRATNSAR